MLVLRQLSSTTKRCLTMSAVAASRTRLEVLETTTISLTRTEQNVLNTLQEVIKANSVKGTIVRIAGGWVRDKLLNLPNHDFDIALDNMTGQEFATTVSNYLQSKGQKAHSVAVIQANPGQSKHLETATTKIHGIDVDFVNLRCEEYAQDSRIPSMRFGSAHEDAERRDFTLNSLFYNVNEGCIEDYTGKGYEDLKNFRIRTPLEPLTTLMDDPLRVMRAVRFASKYAFHVERNLWDTMQRQEVREALQEKVSKERIGTEFSGMMLGPRPVAALRIIEETGLLDIVLQPTRILPKEEADQKTIQAAKGKITNPFSEPYPDTSSFGLRDYLSRGMKIIEMLNKQWEGDNANVLPSIHIEEEDALLSAKEDEDRKLEYHHSVEVKRNIIHDEAESETKWEKEWTQSHMRDDHSSNMDGTRETVQNLLLSAVTWPCRMLLADDEVKRKHPIHFITAVIKCHLKWNMKIGSRIQAIQLCAERLLSVYRELADQGFNLSHVNSNTRLLLGKAIREAGPVWTSALHVAAAVQSLQEDNLLKVLTSFNVIPEAAKTWKVDKSWSFRPHLDGKKLMEIGAQKGPQLGALIEEQMEWCLLHPEGTYDECVDYMKGVIERMKAS